MRRPTPLAARLQAEQDAAATVAPAPLVRPHAGKTGHALQASIREVEQARADLQPMIARCGADGCDWSYVGTAGEGRELARAHREEHHPELQQSARRGRGRKKLDAEATARREIHAKAAERSQVDALARMDAGEPQELAEKIGEGDPDATRNDTATDNADVDSAAEPLDRVDAPPATDASSPSPSTWSRKTRSRDELLQFIRDFNAEHGHPPGHKDLQGGRGLTPSGRAFNREFGSLGAAVEAAGFPRPTRGTRYSKPLDSAGDPGSATPAESSGPRVDERVVTDSAAPPPSAPHDADAGSPGENGETSSAPADTRAPGPLDLAELTPPPGGASTDLTVRRDPIRTADIPYDADLLENEAAFLRARAAALLEIASGVRKLDALSTMTREVSDAAAAS